MPIFNIDGRQITFTHIPKTGGSSVENWLQQHGEMSLFSKRKPDGLFCPPQHFHRALLEEIGFGSSQYSFVIVRDPLDRILSEFFWAHRNKMPKILNSKNRGIRRFLPPSLANKFDEWVRKQFKVTEQNPFHRGNHMRPQIEFLGLPNERVFRFEDGFESIFQAVAGDLDLPPPQSRHENKSKRTVFSIHSKTRKTIDDYYREDFKQLGYQFACER